MNKSNMNKSKPSGTLAQIIFTVLTAILVIAGLALTLYSPEQISAAPPSKSDPSQTNSTPQKIVSPAPSKPVTKKQITGAELYSINCNRCHSERYPTERTAAQWKTIMLHMQVRANLPASQARLILKYLQENSGR
ncbi:MAG TPA: hypothetical protein VNV43_05640 [Candidatus Acidoferrales bacterium]|jgi:hypothetical protein|nr:hypothetical protein [Candidatus Acidoferrales bacterium]